MWISSLLERLYNVVSTHQPTFRERVYVDLPPSPRKHSVTYPHPHPHPHPHRRRPTLHTLIHVRHLPWPKSRNTHRWGTRQRRFGSMGWNRLDRREFRASSSSSAAAAAAFGSGFYACVICGWQHVCVGDLEFFFCFG
jgi:hypothetical protein